MAGEEDELLEIVDPGGKVLRLARRAEIHGCPELLHRVVHVLVFNSRGDLLLQKRSMKKDVAPGAWDTSVGGHVMPGEPIVDAANRELLEELGIQGGSLTWLYGYTYSDHIESELVHSFSCFSEGPFRHNAEEIDEVRFWSLDLIRRSIGSGIFSGNFEAEIGEYLKRIK